MVVVDYGCINIQYCKDMVELCGYWGENFNV